MKVDLDCLVEIRLEVVAPGRIVEKKRDRVETPQIDRRA